MNPNISNILIIEDDFQLALEWQNALKVEGYPSDIVSNADDANLLLHNNYDCFIIDLFHVQDQQFLPNGGIRAIGKIRKRDASYNKTSLIITVTGYYREKNTLKISTEEITISLGANYVLKKPLDFTKILELINGWSPNGV